MRATTMAKNPVSDIELDYFDDMMDTLDAYFHVATCPDHTREERVEAFKLAHDCYNRFANYAIGDADLDSRANAPSTLRMQ